MQYRHLSGHPSLTSPVRMSITVGALVNRTGVPGFTSCARVIPNRTSAFCCISTPESVTGAVAPDMGSVSTMTGSPSLAHSNRTSQFVFPYVNGLLKQQTKLTRFLFRTSSLLPEAAARMSTWSRTSRALSAWFIMCFPVFLTIAPNTFMYRPFFGISPGLTG